MKYTLRHLEVFLAVAGEQSISRAAEQLSMSQSAVSAALQEFENRYDMLLFDRSAKRLRLNGLGVTIRTKAESLLSNAQDFDRELKQHEELEPLKVGTSLTIANYLASEYLADYLHRHPRSEVEVVAASSPEIARKVLNFEIDIGLIEAEMHHSDLSQTPWREDRMVVFSRPDHPLATRRQLTDKDILACQWILREPGTAHRKTFDEAMYGLLVDLDIRLQLPQNEAIKNAVRAGLGIGCLSQLAVADDLERGLLVELPLKERPMHRRFYIVTHKHSASSRTVERWMNLCTDHLN
ncbi:LysR family transcriptional regulator [Pseudomaricurvus alkylphenolicus]|uniref:LysR substrate-binding domain-containing protein n=1 Tax=Pseudomaricurvus alkylphenolicus TaxID=1306991 RepID=UPI00141EB00F|nr:LysR substrate-binding domain-containing protein [Pseudomaricurvus alkylphenolicus]NIB45178.1 LysR family transcriptional regulator [Pseudomaricurvus alkylphenolicus]